MSKPIVTIVNASFMNNRLVGRVVDHPNFKKGEQVITSRIVKVETRNTIYLLEKPPTPKSQERKD